MKSYDRICGLLTEANKKRKQARKVAQRFAGKKEDRRRGSLTPKMREVETALKDQGYGHLKLDNPDIAATARDAISLHRGKNCVGEACKSIIGAHATEYEKDVSKSTANKQSKQMYRGASGDAGTTIEKLRRERPDQPRK